MGLLKILDGDIEEKYVWKPDSPDETEKAKAKFYEHLRRGFIACKIVNQGRMGMQISEFDPDAEEIFMLGLADGG